MPLAFSRVLLDPMVARFQLAELPWPEGTQGLWLPPPPPDLPSLLHAMAARGKCFLRNGRSRVKQLHTMHRFSSAVDQTPVLGW